MNRKFNSSKSEYMKKISRASNFILTVNPNISYRSLIINEERKRVVLSGLQELGNELEYFFENGSNWNMVSIEKKDINLINYQYSIEQGKLKGFVHLHGLIQFDDRVIMDLPKLKKFVTSYLKQTGVVLDNRNIIVQLKYYKDTTAIVKKYLEKDKFSEIKQPGNISENISGIDENKEEYIENPEENIENQADLTQLNRKQLVELARKKNRPGYSRMLKSELIRFIMND